MGALDGLRVIDFGQWNRGPLAAMLLTDQGAEVIRVDPRGGPHWDTPANAVWNRGKQRIALDLKQSADRRSAEQLIASADVVIENFRPGVMDRLGLGAEQMTARDDRLIYLSLPGFGATDERRDIPAWEGVVSAGVGTYSTRLTGGDTPQPVYTAVPIASVYGAFVGVAATAMALVARERDGLGQRIESPLHDALYQAIGIRGIRYHDTEPTLRFVPWVGAYECADGRWVFFHAAFSHFIRQFCEAAGVPEWLDEPWSDGPRVTSDPELAAEARRRLADIFKTRPALEWEALINAAGPPTVRCLDSHEWLEEEHARASEAVVQLDDPQHGPMLQPGLQVRMSATPGAVGHAARPPDADRETILAALPNAAQPAPYAGAPRLSRALEGIRALDLCIILAGPTCGRTLAEYGADVIKIDNPNREGDILFHEDVNRGKRSIFLDLKSDDGQAVFHDLVDSADVVVQNYRLGAMRRLGIDYPSLAARKPELVYATLNAFGEIGPWAERAGWEQLAQAATGMQTRYGGDGPPTLQPFAINDYGTGIMGAFGVGLALYHRERSGRGQEIYTALARTAGTLQSAFLHGYEGKRWEEPRGQSALGEGALQRLYEAADGWLFLGAAPDQLPALDGVPGLSGVAAAGERLEAELAWRIRARPLAHWLEHLRGANIGAAPVGSTEAAMQSDYAVARGLSLTREHAGRGQIRTTGTSPILSRTPATPGAPAPIPGSDEQAILAALEQAAQ